MQNIWTSKSEEFYNNAKSLWLYHIRNNMFNHPKRNDNHKFDLSACWDDIKSIVSTIMELSYRIWAKDWEEEKLNEIKDVLWINN